MKRFSVTMAALLVSSGLMLAATNDLTSLIQRGLFEEEANHNIEAAMRAYQAAVDGIDKDRQLDATAVFRLGECWRKLGKTNEANFQYQRVLREFPEQTNLTKLCVEYLGETRASVPSEVSPNGKSQEIEAAYNDLKVKWALIEGELAMVTNMNRTDMESYFTTAKPDGALQALEAARVSAEAALNEFTGKGYGPQSQEIVSRKSIVDQYKREADGRVDALVRNLQVEAELLHKQGDTVRALSSQSKLIAPDLATSSTAAPSAEDEEVRKIKEMIQNSPDLINGPGDGPLGGSTPLQMAVLAGNVTAAELLLANGAEPNGTCRFDGSMPLGIAADRGNKAMLELLLAKGANVNAADRISDRSRRGSAPLHRAAEKGFKTVVEFLLAHKADVNGRDNSGSTPLEEAARNGFRNVAELLIGSHADVDARDKSGSTPLDYAISRDHPELVQLLLANKADVNSADNQGETPLFVAIRNNQPEIVKLLLANKADVNTVLKSGLTPLLLAASKSDIDIGIVQSLLQNGADVQAYLTSDPNGYSINSKGSHALDFAIGTRRTNVLELLLASHADPNATWYPGGTQGPLTPLIRAELNSHVNAEDEDSLKILLDHGADPDLTDNRGRTALIYAVIGGNASAVQELLDHHADVNKPDNEGKPPLAYVQNDNPPPQAMPRQPGAPMPPASQRARQQSSADIKALLLKAGANEDFQRLGRIFITQKGTGSIGSEIFHKDANGFTHFTLFDLIAEAYSPTAMVHGGSVAFPDLAHVTINRLKTGGRKEEINVNLDEMLKSGDCAKDVPLEWGDIVQVPQLDHGVNELWNYFPAEVTKTLSHCLTAKVEIVVKGQTTKITLMPALLPPGSTPAMPMAFMPGRPSSFSLDETVHHANVLMLSSNLSRVKVTRSGKSMTLNLEPPVSSDLWLRDGDVIEIPERDADVPATK